MMDADDVEAATADAAAFLGHFRHMWSQPFDERAWWQELEQCPFGNLPGPTAAQRQAVAQSREAERWPILAHYAVDGDARAASLLRSYAAKKIENGEAIPECARKYIASFLVNGPPPEKPGKKSRDFQQRNFLIALEVLKLEHRGFHATRNRANQDRADARKSGCSIVADALSRIFVYMTEGAVEKIWGREEDRVRQSDFGERLREGRPVHLGIVRK